MGFAAAVKSFIVNPEGRILIIKRSRDDRHKPGLWDIPGGRLRPGEDAHAGLKRETKEETGIDIDVLIPLGVHNFTRDDGQEIAMTIFLCKPAAGDVKLGGEHTEYLWAGYEEALDKLPDFREEIERFRDNCGRQAIK